jgi:hypothetical protein
MAKLTHVVLMRLRPGVAATDRDNLAARILALATASAGPNSCVIGPNVTEEPLAQGFQTFPNHGALDAYHVNPAHLPISLSIRTLAETVLVFDFSG